jgi:hypothetical protein
VGLRTVRDCGYVDAGLQCAIEPSFDVRLWKNTCRGRHLGRAMKDLMKGTYGRRWSTDVDIVSYCQSTCVAQGQFPPGP